MLQVLRMYNNNNTNGWPSTRFAFVIFVIITTTNYSAKSFEALDFGETFVATSDLSLTEELTNAMQFKSLSCNNSNNNNNKTNNYKNATALALRSVSVGEGDEASSVVEPLLSRRKRFLAFPLGSSFSCSVCLTTGVIGNPNYQYLSMGLNWGLAYELPNSTWALHHIHTLEHKNDEKDMEKMEKPIIKRRNRRELYHKMETIMNNHQSITLDMFALSFVPMSLFDYRLIVINALIYDLIATEIVNLNARSAVVVGASTHGMPEFDKSATLQTARTAATTTTMTMATGKTEILRQAGEKQENAFDIYILGGKTAKVSTSKLTTKTTVQDSDKVTELAFVGQKRCNDNEFDVDDNEIGDNNNNKNNNYNDKCNNVAQEQQNITSNKSAIAAQTSDDIVFVPKAPAMPFDMMTDNFRHFGNSESNGIMPTINARVDNFQNDINQIASAKATTATAPEHNITGFVTGVVTTARTTKTGTTTTPTDEEMEMTAILGQSTTIKTNVINAIKSAARQFTTNTTKATTTTPEKNSKTTTSIVMRSSITSSAANKESITMSKMPSMLATKSPPPPPTTTTTTTRNIQENALQRWSTLHGHDLLSSTNGMSNCRVIRNCTNVEKFKATINKKEATAAKMPLVDISATLESSSHPASSAATTTTTTKIPTANTAATTTTNTTNKQSWPTTTTTPHIKSSDAGHKRKANMTIIKTNEKCSPLASKNNNNNNTTVFNTNNNSCENNNNNNSKCITATPTPSVLHNIFHTLTMPAALAMSSSRNTTRTTTVVAVNSTATTEMANDTAATATTIARTKSSATLQSHWQRILSRHKRYLAFPEGSSFSVALCITVGIIGNPRYDYMSFGINWGVSYDLPNSTWVLNQLHGLSRRPTPTAVLHRRSKRELYERIGEAVDNMGYNGRDCVLRALCESRQYFARHKMGMIGEMLRVIFSLPKQRLFTRELRESSDITVYDHAYRKARAMDCSTQYDCSFSLLELAFGKYVKPPTNYYNDKFGM